MTLTRGDSAQTLPTNGGPLPKVVNSLRPAPAAGASVAGPDISRKDSPASWDEFPNGRFGDARSPAYGEMDGYGVSLKLPVRNSPRSEVCGKCVLIWSVNSLERPCGSGVSRLSSRTSRVSSRLTSEESCLRTLGPKSPSEPKPT